ncbi:MAG: hypothetical protein K6G54_03320 [Oscillospiraceae bacterium]|nr:hypothetical protein [Oscillospiraceae bacterium]
MDRKTLLDRAARSPEERVLLAHVLDKCELCRARSVPAHTDFLSPAELRSAEELLHAALYHDGWAALGGYDEAERRLLCFLPPWQDAPETDALLAVLRVRWHESERVGHRDLLGSLMALGVSRSKLGDILASPQTADVVVCADIADYLAREWTQAGRVHLHAERIAPEALNVPERKVRAIRDTVATLRLDAVTASGLGMSRAKAAELIAAGRVQLNHRETTKPDAPVRALDTVSVRGFGRFTLAEVGGQSRKGRTAILIERYL